MINVTPDFLSSAECQELIKLIEERSAKSVVSGGRKVDRIRNSSTCMLDFRLPIVWKVFQRIADKLNKPMENGEVLQGQKYEPGQYFKEHNDFFGKNFYNHHCLYSGNRNHTLMIYLNDDLEGGETVFRLLDKSYKPTVGMALDWKNMENNKVKPITIHEGQPVTKGKKYIITSWWRQKTYNPLLDVKLFVQSTNENKDQAN